MNRLRLVHRADGQSLDIRAFERSAVAPRFEGVRQVPSVGRRDAVVGRDAIAALVVFSLTWCAWFLLLVGCTVKPGLAAAWAVFPAVVLVVFCRLCRE